MSLSEEQRAKLAKAQSDLQGSSDVEIIHKHVIDRKLTDELKSEFKALLDTLEITNHKIEGKDSQLEELYKQIGKLAEKLNLTGALATVNESIKSIKFEAKDSTRVTNIAELAGAITKGITIPESITPEDSEKIIKGLAEIRTTIKEQKAQPQGQTARDYIPVRRVQKLGNAYIFDDSQWSGNPGGGGSSSSGGASGSVTVTDSVLPTGAATAAKQLPDNHNVVVTSAPTTAVSQSGTWTVQPGNTANTTPWLVKNQSVTVSSQTALTTTATVSSAAGSANGGSFLNLNSSPAYIQIFDTTGAVTLGTTVPTFVQPIPANATAANGSAFVFSIVGGVTISNGIKIAATTTATGLTTVSTALIGYFTYR
jgi:hypothetical protein